MSGLRSVPLDFARASQSHPGDASNTNCCESQLLNYALLKHFGSWGFLEFIVTIMNPSRPAREPF